MRALNEKEAIIIINRFKGITTAPVNTEEVREACALAIAALRKQVPRKPKEIKGFTINQNDEIDLWECPECGIEILGDAEKYCYSCGQALDWG